jgi:DNA-binding XRE family transcriptional regulator
MHWIQTLREQLQITQEELGYYLQLSHHTIRSVEQGRRPLPPESLVAAAALFDAVRNASLSPVTIDLPTPTLRHHTSRAKLHKQCCRRLDRSVGQLDKMKKSHAAACFALGVYRALAQALPTPVSKQEHARLTWAQRQIKDTLQRIDDTNPVAQDLLAAEIVGLKNVVHSLDLVQLNAEHNTPITKGPEPLSL